MELATLGQAAVPPALTPIRAGQTRLRKCYDFFAITLPSNAIKPMGGAPMKRAETIGKRI